jgi:hypothetical protein
MKGEAFFQYVSTYLHQKWNDLKLERPLVLTVDGYSGHQSYELFKWCRENGVILIVLFPNSTHLLQVCDVAVFGALKTNYYALHQEWKNIASNKLKIFDEIEFVQVLKKANDKTLTPDLIINGWRATGLQPFDFENVKKDRILSSSSCITDAPLGDGMPVCL